MKICRTDYPCKLEFWLMYHFTIIFQFMQKEISLKKAECQSKIESCGASIGKPAVQLLVHCMTLVGSHGIVQITYCRWRCGLLVMQRPLLLLFPMTYQFLLCL